MNARPCLWVRVLAIHNAGPTGRRARLRDADNLRALCGLVLKRCRRRRDLNRRRVGAPSCTCRVRVYSATVNVGGYAQNIDCMAETSVTMTTNPAMSSATPCFIIDVIGTYPEL